MPKKDRFYFDHDYYSRNDDKILELRSDFGAEGYGVFWMIVEAMAESETGGLKGSLTGGLSHGFGVAKDRLQAILSFCVKIDLFYETEGYIYSKRVIAHKTYRNSLSKWGKEGAETKKKKATLKPPFNHEIKEDKISNSISNQEHDKIQHTSTATAAAIEVGSEKVGKAANEAWTDKFWVDNTCKAHVLTEENLKQWMYQYNASITNDPINGFNAARYKKMFGGWLQTQFNKGYKLSQKKLTGKEQLTTLK